MRTSTRITAAAALAIVLLLAATPAPAGTSRQLFVHEGTTLNGTELDEGFYKLTWKRNGSKLSYVVALQRGGKVVARADAHTEVRDEKQESGGVSYRTDGDGGRALSEIRFAGKRQVIVIDS